MPSVAQTAPAQQAHVHLMLLLPPELPPALPPSLPPCPLTQTPCFAQPHVDRAQRYLARQNGRLDFHGLSADEAAEKREEAVRLAAAQAQEGGQFELILIVGIGNHENKNGTSAVIREQVGVKRGAAAECGARLHVWAHTAVARRAPTAGAAACDVLPNPWQ